MVNNKTIKESLRYNRNTGIFTWLKRPLNHFKTKNAFSVWNSRFSGKEAGTLLSSKRGGSYIRIRIDGWQLFAHKLAFVFGYGIYPEEQVDHINGDTLDNRLVNLRIVTQVENNKNKSIPKNNKSGCVGVSWNKNNNKWLIMIGRIYLGYQVDFFKACCIRKSAEIKHGYHENHAKRCNYE